MTEAEWLGSLPEPMLEFVRAKASSRKLRLVALACCRSVWHLLTHPGSRRAIELLEIRLDQASISDEEWRAINHAAREGFKANQTPACMGANSPRTPTCAAAYAVVRSCDEQPIYAAGGACYQSVNAQARYQLQRVGAQAFFPARPEPDFRSRSDLIHCIFGNPFRPVTINPAWLTTTVTNLAQAIYVDRAFDRLPILADALEDAGCSQQDILSHLRGGGEHCRGCWVVDLLLGRE